MNTTSIINSASRMFYRTGFKIKKHSPEILMVAGIAGVVTSAVMACKATTKISDILDDTKDQVATVHQTLEDGNVSGEPYSEADSKKDLTIIYTQTAIKFVKLYGPAIVLGTASIASILSSNNILRKRNVALAAAYTAVDKGFKEYRNRVVERFGQELDHELRYNIRAQEIEEVTTDENGNETVEKKTVTVTDPLAGYSPYAKFFDDGCTGWTKDPDMNLMFLRSQETYANQILQRRGHLFLNEVYDSLGIKRTAAGATVGWVYDKNHQSYVDFGIYSVDGLSESGAERRRAFVNGYERTVLLDFNVDGDILSAL